mmetsp:Transcript_50207/g.73742  ORF Transcript_50207/g.73742 Transcript_50207/m.73742 type:complete len:264 (-) Transcript_50207:1641-2432(-)
MGSHIPLEQKPHRVTRDAERRLYSNPNIAKHPSTQQHLSIITATNCSDSRLVEPSTPIFRHARRITFAKPGSKVFHSDTATTIPLVSIIFVPASGLRLSVSDTHHLHDILGVLGQITHIIAFVPHPAKKLIQRLGHIEKRGSASGANTRRIPVEHNCYAAVLGCLPAETGPSCDALGQGEQALFHKTDFACFARAVGEIALAVAKCLVAATQAAEGDGINGAIQLRQCVQYNRLQASNTLLKPCLHILNQQRRGHKVGHILGQ